MKKTKGFTLIELMIVIAIIGILAAIAFQAYSSYMKKAKFTEATQQLESVKTQVALCLQEVGITRAADCANNGSTIAAVNGVISGFGWELRATPADYKTKYVASITVTGTSQQAETVAADTEVSRITVVADAAQFGSAYDLIVVGQWTQAGQLDWQVDAASTCIAAKLCAKGDK